MIQEFIAQLETSLDANNNDEHSAWLEWAKEKAKQLDPLNSIDSVLEKHFRLEKDGYY